MGSIYKIKFLRKKEESYSIKKVKILGKSKLGYDIEDDNDFSFINKEIIDKPRKHYKAYQIYATDIDKGLAKLNSFIKSSIIMRINFLESEINICKNDLKGIKLVNIRKLLK